MHKTKNNGEQFSDLGTFKRQVSSYDDSELQIAASPSLIVKKQDEKLATNGFTS